ncbi:MAG TPA: LPXTG cell wall anchor domain-containing protein [Firmicutes bacterium]|nr:LPXTG cell wall anchor domain-containing protein [Bacillota bacterium]
MKKKFLVLVCALVLVFGLSLTAAAEASPSGSQITETGGGTDKAPATGESNAVIYAAAAAAVLTGTAVIAKKRLEAVR